MSCDALAKALEAAPELLTQVVVAGRIECVIALLFAALFVGCGIYAFRWSRHLEEELKIISLVVTVVCTLFAAGWALAATGGLIKSYVAPWAYAVEQLLR